MRSILLAIVLFFAGPAFAEDMIARHGGDAVRLTDKPCTNAAVQKHLRMLPAPSAQSRAARSSATAWPL